jgi:hypothetical protein
MTQENDPATTLTRSNLLRLSTAQLLAESTLHIHPPSLSPHSNTGYLVGEERSHHEVKWSPVVRKYLHVLRDIVVSLPNATLRPEICKVDDGYKVPLVSDKYTTEWEFDTPTSMSLVPIGSFSHAGNAGLTNRHANGNNVPVLDVGVMMEGFVGGKDYLNGRYGDVSKNPCSCHRNNKNLPMLYIVYSYDVHKSTPYMSIF